MNHSKAAIVISKTISWIQLLTGILFAFFFGIFTIMTIVEMPYSTVYDLPFLFFCLFGDALGIWLIVSARRKQTLLKRFKEYVMSISNNPTGYIPDIAASFGTSAEIVEQNLERMIHKKFFPNAYIDKNANRIVIVNRQTTQNTADQNTTDQNTANQNTSAPTGSAASGVEMVTVKCKGCGGINTIAKGQTGECDYCGSAIKGNP